MAMELNGGDYGGCGANWGRLWSQLGVAMAHVSKISSQGRVVAMELRVDSYGAEWGWLWSWLGVTMEAVELTGGRTLFLEWVSAHRAARW